MSNNRILEIDSTYRNRNEWPLPGAFEIPISQSGTKDKSNALDPVSLSVPLQSWTCNNLNTNNSAKVSGSFTDPTVVSLGYITSNYTIIASTPNSGSVGFQEIPNYYQGLVMIFRKPTTTTTVTNVGAATPPTPTTTITTTGTTTVTTTTTVVTNIGTGTPPTPDTTITTIVVSSSTVYARRRIKEYKFLSTISNNDIGIFTFSTSVPEVDLINDTYEINDSSNITDPNHPIFFVPFGRPQINGYTGFILYNENQREYRNISEYNAENSMLFINISSGSNSLNSGVITGWLLSHNYSIRKKPPYIPLLGVSYTPIAGPITIATLSPPITTTYTTSTSTVILSGMPQIYTENYFKNDSIRLLPASYDYSATNDSYLATPENETRIINTSLSYENNVGVKYIVLTVTKPFSVTPTNTLNVEIMNFSYDNLFPFVYSGSLVSQQELVCYEIKLAELVLPNYTLSAGEGGKIAFYPYVHVELTNVSAPGGHLRNTIYSNNPNTVKVTFRCPISDLASPFLSTFVKLSCQTTQTIKFKPNDNLFFSVTLPNGQIFDTTLPEFYSPSPPNPVTQISASFSIRRV